ncbi:hypothetical protein Btru_072505 [Bulinus truncatus]|nr:hypothetical protein Btru_072505 [Bulinus truncatus]
MYEQTSLIIKLPLVATIEVATIEVATIEVATIEVATIEVATIEVATIEVATIEVATLEEPIPPPYNINFYYICFWRLEGKLSPSSTIHNNGKNKDPIRPIPYDPIRPIPYDPIRPIPYDPIRPIPYDPIRPIPYDPIRPIPYDPIRPIPYDPIRPIPYDHALFDYRSEFIGLITDRGAMRINLTKLVRGLIVLVLMVTVFNVLTFLQEPQNGIPGLHLSSGSLSGLFRAHMGRNFPIAQEKKIIKLKSTETCKDLHMKQVAESEIFQTIGSDNQTFVHSAFQDDGGWIRIVGMRQMIQTGNSDVFCQIWYTDTKDDPLVVGDVQTEFIPEDHGRRYTSSFFLCKTPTKYQNLKPYAVSLVKGRCDPATNAMLVHSPGTRSFEFTVCVTPLNYKYSRAYELVEMIEMNKLLGAQRVVFYNHSTGPNVDKVLDYYKLKNEVEVIQWHLPVRADTWPPTNEPEVHYFAQLSALNDCLYRYKNRSHYLVYTDMDEFIVPRQHKTWKELLEDNEKSNKDLSFAQAQCTFFRKEWPKPHELYLAAVNKYKSVILQHTVRESHVFPHGSRSKYIVNPRLVKTVGVHNIWSHSGTAVMLPSSEALLHHYRSWEQPNDPQPRESDLTAVEKYGQELARRLESVWSMLSDVPLNINISSYGPFVS